MHELSPSVIERFIGDAWTDKGANAVPFTYFPVAEQAVLPLKHYFGDCYHVAAFFLKEDYVAWHWHEEDMMRLRQKLIDKVRSTSSFLSSLHAEFTRRLTVFDSAAAALEGDLSCLDDRSLLATYFDWYKAYLDEYAIAIGLQDAFSMHAERFLIPKLREQLGPKADSAIPLLLAPAEETFLSRERRELIALSQKRGDPSYAGLLSEHAKRWHWLRNNYAHHEVLDAKDFQTEIDNLVEPSALLASMDAELLRARSAKERYLPHLDEEASALIAITELFAFMQDERKKYVMLATHYHHLFLSEVARRLDVPPDILLYSHPYEIQGFLAAGEVPLNLLSARRDHGLMVLFTEEGYLALSGEDAERANGRLWPFAAPDSDLLKGLSAYPGVARGPVRIISTYSDIHDVPDGAVIVSSMTRPEMMPALRRASAIVTDEGGITSHAAIVSREMRIPCVIGTKCATTTLKDGDLVEVDADKGEVHKL